VIGYDPYRMTGHWDPEPVADGIAAGVQQFADHGVGVEVCLFATDGSEDIPAVITTALSSRTWECVVVGSGVRRAEGDLFEQVINLVRRHAPDAAIAFNSRPEDIYHAAARWIDVL
jgi:hypothetical protein